LKATQSCPINQVHVFSNDKLKQALNMENDEGTLASRVAWYEAHPAIMMQHANFFIWVRSYYS
jgi:hypothetical protein